VVYYYNKEDFQPSAIRGLKLGMTNADADWHGNLAGDLMWTIEPIVILSSSMIMDWIKPKIAKVKTD
jgi:heme/copper-type cytochrome/quinol oxidase subunit 2